MLTENLLSNQKRTIVYPLTSREARIVPEVPFAGFRRLRAAQAFLAVELLGRIEEEKKPGLRNGAMSSAMEELVEAMAFQHFLNHGTCIRKDDLLKEYGIQVTTDEYLGGVLDVRREGA